MKFNVSEELVQPVPEVGKNYHFFDDGKISLSRHSVAKVLRVISLEESKNVMVKTFKWDEFQYDDESDEKYIEKSVYENWKKESEYLTWIMNKETDFLVECWIPQYDDNNIWFARTITGGWFSFDIQNSWQSGRLDVDFKCYNDLKEYSDDKSFFEQFDDLKNFDFNSVKHYKE